MTLTPDDIEAIRLLLREELVTLERFDEFDRRFDTLFKENEKREPVIKHQLAELEKKVA